MPISLIICDRLFENFTQHVIKCLRQAICLRIIIRGVIPCDVTFCNKSLHLVGLESFGIVGGDSMRNSKAIYNMSL
jgi:hypothetical protein